MTNPNLQFPTSKGEPLERAGARVAACQLIRYEFHRASAERLPLRVGSWALGVVAAALGLARRLSRAGGAEGQTQPARRRVAAHCRHDDYPRLQPSRRARAGAVWQAGAGLRLCLVPGRGRLHDHRGVHESDVRGPGVACGQDAVWAEPGPEKWIVIFSKQANVFHTQLSGGPGRAPAGDHAADRQPHGNPGLLFPGRRRPQRGAGTPLGHGRRTDEV